MEICVYRSCQKTSSGHFKPFIEVNQVVMEHWRSLELKKCENKIKVLIIFKLGVVYIIMLKKNIIIYVFQEFKN